MLELAHEYGIEMRGFHEKGREITVHVFRKNIILNGYSLVNLLYNIFVSLERYSSLLKCITD
jgi:hypothetical protein